MSKPGNEAVRRIISSSLSLGSLESVPAVELWKLESNIIDALAKAREETESVTVDSAARRAAKRIKYDTRLTVAPFKSHSSEVEEIIAEIIVSEMKEKNNE